MADLRVKGFITWIYFEDLARAMNFYEKILGLEMTVDQARAMVSPS